MEAMKTLRALITLVLLCTLLTPAVFAQPAEKPMTEKELSRIIDDWPLVYKWFEDRKQKISSTDDGSIAAALFMSKDFNAFIAKRGWSEGRFAYVMGTAFSLMYIVALEQQNPEVVKQFDSAIAEIEASDLPAADKADAIKSINEVKAMMLSVSTEQDINQAELKLVRARYADLLKIAEQTQLE